MATSKQDEETIEVMSAVSAIVVPQGEQVAGYLGGNFQDTVIHVTSTQEKFSVLAFILDSHPKTAIMIISDPAVEAQVVHEFNKMKEKILHSVEGVAVEIRTSTASEFATVDRKILAFWDTLKFSVENSHDEPGIRRCLLDAKDNYLQIHGRFSPILYQMNSYSAKAGGDITNFEMFKKQTLEQIKIWKKETTGSE